MNVQQIFAKNPVCALLGIDVPIIQGGMVWASGWRLASGVSNAGGLGVLGSGSMTPQMLEQQIDETRTATDAPFGVNIPLALPHAEDHARVCMEKDVKIVITAAGSPHKYTSQFKERGMIVLHVVPDALLAKKVAQAGCDAVVVEGTEAGGHNGRDGITSLVAWRQVVKAVELPVIAAGGIGDGWGMAAAFALGARGVQIGTRFAVTVESHASPAYKDACVAATARDAVLFNRQTMPIRALHNRYVAHFCQLQNDGAPDVQLRQYRGTGRSRRGVFEGDTQEGELVAGQVCGLIDDIPSIAELMDRLCSQFNEASVF